MVWTTSYARPSLAVIVAVLAADCGGEVAIQPTAAPTITLDGDLSDWPTGVTATADGRWLYIRIKLPVAVTLQANREPHVIAIDYDGDPETGRRETVQGVRYGLDLQITFSPPADDRDQPGRGVEVVSFDADGTPQRPSHAAVDLLAAPTYASRSFELRVSRDRVRDLLGMAPTSSVRGFVAALDLDDCACGGDSGLELLWQFGADGLRAPHGDSALPEVALPERPAQTVRVVSWNVLRGSPMESPGRFARILRALAPDVVLVQEWDDADEDVLVEWFEQNIGPSPQWYAVAGPEGVAIVSRLPLARVGLGGLVVPRGAPGAGRPVLFVAAKVATEQGELLVGSAHLTCCGSAGDERDQRRLAEATAIRAALTGLPAATRRLLVVGGDINLVGSRGPLNCLGDALDANGTDLTPAPTRVLGDWAFYTWTDSDSEFAPGRLDWLLYSDATLRVLNAFTVDTARMSDALLKTLELRREDSRASDHLPVLVDLSRSTAPSSYPAW